MRGAAVGVLALFSAALPAATLTVDNTGDSGAGSLRQAILNANATPAEDTIVFAIVGSGVHTISPATALPTITQPVTIDGYTQAGATPNTDPFATNAVLRIVLDGSSSIGGTGLRFGAGSSGSTLRGLVVSGWSAANVELDGADNTVAGCFIGTDASGLAAPSAGVGFGVYSPGASNTIGGPLPADRNLISGNSHGVEAPAAGTQIVGNLIGVDATGEAALPNPTGVYLAPGAGIAVRNNVVSGNGTGIVFGGSGSIQGNRVGPSASGVRALGNVDRGMVITGSAPLLVGGPGAGDGNVISGNGGVGLELSFTDGVVVQGNLIGTDSTGVADFGNAGGGIRIVSATDSVIGGPAAGEGNVVAFNGAYGIELHKQPYPSGNSIRGNSIHSNAPIGQFPNLVTLGIDLGFDGPTANDAGDADDGANGLQNYPLVLSAAAASPQGTGTRVQGSLHAKASSGYTLDFYSNPACAPRPRAFAEARTYLGAASVSTDASGDAVFDETLPPTIGAGETVVATATDALGNTSEISPRVVFDVAPPNGPAGGGAGVTITGTDFEPGATVSIGAALATDVTVVDARTITATAPGLAPGSVGDVTVSNPSGLSGTFARGWVADFLDAADASFFYPYVVTLVGNGITAGCGGGNYCPAADVTRAQMAVFLLKAEHGLCYAPPPCAGTFPDVACPSLFADWIEALAAEGITGGCGGGDYCPLSPVRRDQIAVFLLKAEHGPAYTPPACSGVFGDVACPSTFADWIERLAAEQITGGCGGGDYCPHNPNTRGQMAVFLTKTFNLR